MNTIDRKNIVREYKETVRPAGVFGVINLSTGKALIGISMDLPGMLNRQRFQLESGLHPDSELQKDWNELGPSQFSFEVLDFLQELDGPRKNPKEDLPLLKELWLEKLTAAGKMLYRQSHRKSL